MFIHFETEKKQREARADKEETTYTISSQVAQKRGRHCGGV